MASLFERLEAASVGGAIQPPPSSQAESVLSNVRRILNARQGCCQTRHDFGLPDVVHLSDEASEAVPEIGRAVKLLLERFEPRLRNITVRPMPTAEMMSVYTFAISATLSDDARGGGLRFDAVVDRDGQVHLKN